MQIIIHCGLDKAGSTAIQAHVGLFRAWLLRHGVYVPTAGLSGFGHVALFRDLDSANWQPLLNELNSIDRAEFSYCFLSYEGICKFDEQKLGLIRDYLCDYQVTTLFYLREQVEILQSGYLQQLKTEKHALSIADLNTDHSLLANSSRDYLQLLQKFESIFGNGCIAARRYWPADWRDGSIVWDLFELLGCPPDDDFTPARQKQNVSLDLQSASILNVFDVYNHDPAARVGLVEDLLWLVGMYPGGAKFFLDDAAVQYVRGFYRQSNAALTEHYGIEFEYRDCATGASEGDVSYIDELAGLACHPRWTGDELCGTQLAKLLHRRHGWSRLENWGVWSLGDVSYLEFRLPKARFTGFEEAFTLYFRGRYFGDNLSTQIWINDTLLEDTDLRDAAICVPMALLDDTRVLRLELRHDAAAAPAEMGTGNDRRRLAYGLEGIRYQFTS